MRLLLAEDDPLNVELFVATLEDDGHAVTVERNGIAALTRALSQPFDLIVLDVQLPDLDGITICQRLRAAGIGTPALAVTALALNDQVARGLAAGFDEYLTKPISPAALRDAVRRYGTVA